jgi:hypothetical protein
MGCNIYFTRISREWAALIEPRALQNTWTPPISNHGIKVVLSTTTMELESARVQTLGKGLSNPRCVAFTPCLVCMRNVVGCDS